MMLRKRWGMGVVLSCALCAAAFAAEGDVATPAAIKSDGAYLNEEFNGAALPAGWELIKGGNRAEVAFADGRCIIKYGKGDNFVTLPPLAINLEEPFVIETSFILPPAPATPDAGPQLPATHATTYSIFCVNREGGEFQAQITPTDEAVCVIMTRSRPLGILQPGKPYTLAILVQPDGTYKGTLTGPGIDKPVVQSVAGAKGPIKAIVLGNVSGSAVGSLSVDYLKIGKPAK